jgi:hypothetical protein
MIKYAASRLRLCQAQQPKVILTCQWGGIREVCVVYVANNPKIPRARGKFHQQCVQYRFVLSVNLSMFSDGRSTRQVLTEFDALIELTSTKRPERALSKHWA